ncbi:hypothetical protein SCUCBS95973_009358 [Sporothrix curviconia]|uniref:F-box domain-containing protein n=1 Tax=Sporothrix curviconia TaxID=1260050 RepID=A0ABP0CUX9_9PEZI
MHLHDLPAELLGEILEAANDPNDLRALVAASPNCLRVFNLFRDRILLSVCLNAVEPEARPAALAIGHVPYIRSYDDLPQQRAFLDEFFGKKTVFDPPSKSMDIASFCGLVCRVVYLVDDYSASAWRLLQSNADKAGSSLSPLSTSSPSETPSEAPLDTPSEIPCLMLSRAERAAFQRGFFLFELFARTFTAYRHSLSERVIGDEAQCSFFLSRVQPWELEAMGCVFLYYQQVIYRHIRLVEDNFVQWVMEAPSLFRLPTSDRPSPQEIREQAEKDKAVGRPSTDVQEKLADGDWKFFYKLDYELHSIDLFTTSRREIYEVTGLFSLLTSLRSLYVYRLMQSDDDPAARVKLVVGADLNFGVGSFFDVAAHLARAQNPSLRGGTIDNRDNNTSGAGFALFRPSEELDFEDGVEDDRALNCALRERAYVFWDAERLKDAKTAGSLWQARDLPLEETRQRYNNYFGPSVQERLHDIGIHHKDAYPLFTKISGTSLYSDLYS